MPRTGGVFSLLSGSKGVPNTTIQSAPYNAQLDDFVQDANQARPITAGGTGATNVTQMRTNFGLVPGTDIQAYSAALKSIADLVTAADRMIYTTAADAYATTALTAFGRSIIDDIDATAARVTLGLGSVALLNSVNNDSWSGVDLAIENGGTGASTAATARTNLNVYAKSETYAKTETYTKAEVDALISDPWAFQPIGAVIAADVGTPGWIPPPKNKTYKYVILSAGQGGVGGYNEGLLSDEVVEGTSPNINSSAIVSLAGSIFVGQRIPLINTSREFIRPGNPAAQQTSQNAAHVHTYTDPGHGHNLNAIIGSGGTGNAFMQAGPAANEFPTTRGSVVGSITGITIQSSGGDEARSRNRGANYYMRIL